MVFIIGSLIVLLTTVGQIFLKVGADKAKGSSFINIYVLLGYMLFLLTIMCSYYLMKIIPMKYFTVIMSLNYITVMIAAKLFLSEEINKNRLTGTILVALGVLVFLIFDNNPGGFRKSYADFQTPDYPGDKRSTSNCWHTHW